MPREIRLTLCEQKHSQQPPRILNDKERMSKDGLPVIPPAFRLRELPNTK
jgi:hypothetical protein